MHCGSDVRARFLSYLGVLHLFACLANPDAFAQLGDSGVGHWAVEVQGGLGTPLGLRGAALDVDVHQAFSVWAGAGKGMMSEDLQVGTGARWHAWTTERRGATTGLGLGATYGRVVVIPIEGAYIWHPAPWAIAEWFAELRWQTGLRLRFVIGGSLHFGTSGCIVEDGVHEVNGQLVYGQQCTSLVQALPYVGLAFGWGR